jgi:hypothetical protein
MVQNELRNGMMEMEKMRSHRNGFLKLKCVSPLKMLTYPLFEETFGVFLFLFLSLRFFSAPSFEALGVSMIFEDIYFFKTSFQVALIY